MASFNAGSAARASRGAGCAGAGSGDAVAGSPSPLPASAIGGQAAGVGWSYGLTDLNDGAAGGRRLGAGSAILLLQIKFLVSLQAATGLAPPFRPLGLARDI